MMRVIYQSAKLRTTKQKPTPEINHRLKLKKYHTLLLTQLNQVPHVRNGHNFGPGAGKVFTCWYSIYLDKYTDVHICRYI